MFFSGQKEFFNVALKKEYIKFNKGFIWTTGYQLISR